jgi:RNA polymerase sigma factor (TIGR02999 family)
MRVPNSIQWPWTGLKRKESFPQTMTSDSITRLLQAFGEGDRGAFDSLMPLAYTELREIARRQLRRLRPGETLSTTALVHEAYIKLVDQDQASWQDRNHFFSIAARAMRQILVNYAVRKQTEKHGGGQVAVDIDEVRLAPRETEAWLLMLDAALVRLETLDPRLPRIVECRFFAGYSEDETAAALDISTRTVRRDWQRARAWLHEELEGAG